MRPGRLIAGILIVILVAIGIIWLDQHGYFHVWNVDERGRQRADVPPTPAPDNTPLTADNSSTTTTPDTMPPPVSNMDPDAQLAATKKAAEDAYTKEKTQEAQGEIPIGTAKADYESTMRKAQADHDAARKAQQTATPNTTATTPSTDMTAANTTPALPRGAVLDTNGNPCMPIQQRRVYNTASGTPVHHRRWRTTMTTTTTNVYTAYAPRTGSCGLLRTNADGTHTVTLPAGMLLNASLDREISTRGSQPGDAFTAFLTGPVTYCGRVIVPAGAAMQGTVAVTRRRGALSDNDSILVLRVMALQANGYTFTLSGSSMTRDMPGTGYRAVTYDTVGNDYVSYRRAGRDVDFPASSVVSFWLQNSAAVSF